MSRIDDILTGAQAAIEANATFSTATVYRRAELKQDEEDKTFQIFLNIANPEPLDAPLIADMRLYPLEVVVKFVLDERTVDPDVKDAVNVLKGTYSDALKTAMRTCQSWLAHPIANVFHVEWGSEDLEYQKEGTQEDKGIRDFRIKQTWNFYTYES